MADNTMKNIPKELFKLEKADASQQEKIERPSLTFWQDVFVRIRDNKGAVISCIILLVLTVMAILGPILSPYAFDQQLDPISSHKLLPTSYPRVREYRYI